MSKTNRAVILSEETYQRILNSSNDRQPVDTCERDTSPIRTTDEDFHQPDTTLHSDSEDQEPTNIDSRASFDPLKNVPAYFKKSADKFLVTLESRAPSIAWSETNGALIVDGQTLEDFTIADLVRVACVPFTRTRVPKICIDHLNASGITKFRNYLLNRPILPKWCPYYRF